MAAAETGTLKKLARATGPDGSDFMVDVIKTLNIDYVVSNPASSFRALHESLIDYGGNKKPEFITCMHEESSVGMAHGYFKATGKAGPLMMMPRRRRPAACHHGDLQRMVRLRSGAEAVGAAPTSTWPNGRPAPRPTTPPRTSTPIVRDYTKWDDRAGVAAALRTVVRAGLQDRDDAAPRAGDDRAWILARSRFRSGPRARDALYPEQRQTAPPQGDTGAVREAARLLAVVERPVIVVDRAARTPGWHAARIQLFKPKPCRPG